MLALCWALWLLHLGISLQEVNPSSLIPPNTLVRAGVTRLPCTTHFVYTHVAPRHSRCNIRTQHSSLPWCPDIAAHALPRPACAHLLFLSLPRAAPRLLPQWVMHGLSVDRRLLETWPGKPPWARLWPALCLTDRRVLVALGAATLALFSDPESARYLEPERDYPPGAEPCLWSEQCGWANLMLSAALAPEPEAEMALRYAVQRVVLNACAHYAFVRTRESEDESEDVGEDTGDEEDWDTGTIKSEVVVRSLEDMVEDLDLIRPYEVRVL